MNLLDVYQRVTTARRCPICNKPDWCLIARDGSSAICQRIESKHPRGEAGFWHPVTGDASTATPPMPVSRPERIVDYAEWDRRACEAQTMVHAAGLNKLAVELGVSTDSLRRLGVGRLRGGWTFPMRDALGRIIGLRVRRDDGSKRAVKGSANGLFMASDFTLGDTLHVVEGDSDTAALLTVGMEAVGRPGCRLGGDLLRLLIAKVRPQVVIFADADKDGIGGAKRLAAHLLPRAAWVKIVIPPAKDMREWIRQGATRRQIQALVTHTGYWHDTPTADDI